ncbi:MAG: fumarylacetoacetate hydrolase family protein [Acidisphaera sp.]|nr:fumarylacetoacetate hydrolase family protein [Acidisphaera sp.]
MTRIDVAAAAEALLAARRTRQWLTALPEGARPQDDGDAYAIQDEVAKRLGPVGGWKVGSATPQSEPFRAPIQADAIFENTDRVPASLFHVIGVEAELAYRFGRDLPPRDAAYTREEVLAAVDTLHPVIELVDTRFTAPGATDPPSHRADHNNNGALAVGAAAPAWRGIDPLRQPVRLTIDGALRHEGVGGNTAGDNIRLLVWMANQGARSLGGLRAGQIVTTGSCSGILFVDPPARLAAVFEGVGRVEIEVA